MAVLAGAAVARLRELNATLCLSNFKEMFGPYRRAEDVARYEVGLRRAGLPSDHPGQRIGDLCYAAGMSENDPHRKLPFHRIEGFGEALIAVLTGFLIWGFYGFPHVAIVAIGITAFACFAAYSWWPTSRP
jgi:hypothetical protein